MIQKSRLFVYTFLAVFLSIVLVGAIVVPILLNSLQQNYFSLQADVNFRQAKSMAQFIINRLEQGTPREEVLEEFQSAISGTQIDKGYVCLVDQNSSDYLCHPMTAAVGMSVSLKNALYDNDFDGKNLVKWEDEIMQGNSGSGLLHYQETPTEIVYFYNIPGSKWTISSHENSELIQQEIAEIKKVLILGSIIFGLVLAFPISIAVRKVSQRYERQLEAEQQKSDDLLLNILPSSVAARMKNDEHDIVDHFQEVSVMFCDLVGFTEIAANTAPEELVTLLNEIFSRFDEICLKFGVEKIKTIGDAYMAVSGVPVTDKDHAKNISYAALEIMEVMKSLEPRFNARIGIHTGEVVAGVIGTSKFSYDLWGDTVNTASRLETNGVVGGILCSEEFKNLVSSHFEFESYGWVDAKGKGRLNCFLLTKKKNQEDLAHTT